MSADNGTISLRKILSVLPLVTRETDVVGWYKNDLVVGAMLTEIDLEEKKHIQNTMLARVSSALKANLSVEQFNQLSISFHWFPEEWQQVLSRRPNAPVFYPDLAKRDQARKLFRILKRAMDIFGSLVALILASPIFARVALAIKLTSRGPILFKQQRAASTGSRSLF
jgi:hypothetical protein